MAVLLPTILLVVVALSYAHEGEQHGTPSATTGSLGPITLSDEAKRVVGIQTEAADLRTIEETATCYGSVEPKPELVYWASSRFAGRVKRVFFDSGQQVRAGDVLVEVESRQVAETPVIVPLSSRIDGTVTDRNVSVGQSVDPETVLYRVTDLATVYVKCDLSEIDAGRVRVGQPARIVPEVGGTQLAGPIALIGGALDDAQRTLPVWIEVKNATRLLRPGMRVRADVVVQGSIDVVTVPRDAILGASGNLFVFVDKDSHYLGVPVGIGRRGPEYVEITDGLVPGDRVVTRGAYELQFAASGDRAPDRGDAARADSGAAGSEIGKQRSTLGVRLSALAQRNLALEVETAQWRALERFRECFGTVEALPSKLHHESSPVAGRVVSVHVVEGETVRRDQLLAKIETLQVGEPPPTIEIRATLDGVITERHVFVGEPVSLDKSLFTIARLDQLQVKCHIPEPEVQALAPGQSAVVYSAAYPNQAFAGKLTYLGGEVEKGTRTLPAYILVDAPQGQLRPNMRAQVDIVISRADQEVIAIPLSAVVSADSGDPFVFVRSGDFFRRVRVVLGERDARYVEVLDGILPGDDVVTRGNHALQFATDSPIAGVRVGTEEN